MRKEGKAEAKNNNKSTASWKAQTQVKTRTKIQIERNSKNKTEYSFKKDFPLLNSGIIYLDNAATTQKPGQVIDRLTLFYEEENASTHSGIYPLSETATKALDDARAGFAKFINAETNEIIFTKNATDSFNMTAEMLSKTGINQRNNIVVTQIEHHSNFVPWQQLAKKTGAELRVAKYNTEKEEVRPEMLVDSNTAIVAFTLMSNVTGLITDSKKIISEIRSKNKKAIIIVDATQAAAHFSIDVKKLDADFLCFSAHKIYGPTGVGILFGKSEILKKLEPSRFGGQMIKSVTEKESTWADIPARFEAGTINSESIVAASSALDYINNAGMNIISQREDELTAYAKERLKQIKGLKIFGHEKSKYGPVIAFTMEGIHPHDIASICARKNVCIRAGHQCCQLFHEALGVGASARLSISFYNTKEDIDALVSTLKEARKIFG